MENITAVKLELRWHFGFPLKWPS